MRPPLRPRPRLLVGVPSLCGRTNIVAGHPWGTYVFALKVEVFAKPRLRIPSALRTFGLLRGALQKKGAAPLGCRHFCRFPPLPARSARSGGTVGVSCARNGPRHGAATGGSRAVRGYFRSLKTCPAAMARIPKARWRKTRIKIIHERSLGKRARHPTPFLAESSCACLTPAGCRCQNYKNPPKYAIGAKRRRQGEVGFRKNLIR